LNEGAGAIVDARTRDAANALAGFWLAAWQKAGRPPCRLSARSSSSCFRRGPQRRRRRRRVIITGFLYPEAEVRKIAAACAPFDALTIAHAGVPYKARANPALCSRAGCARRFVVGLGKRRYRQNRRGDPRRQPQFEQFPGSQHVFVLLVYGWKADSALPAAIAHLKATGAKCCVFTIGTFAESSSVEQFAADIGAAFHDLGESKDIPALSQRTGAAARPG